MVNISYSQNREDILLRRALLNIHKGFYIDVGANDPEKESVTKLFYEFGWSGINIEPLDACYKKLTSQRRRDINIQAVVGRENGVCELLEFPEDGRYSTVDKVIADRHQKSLGIKYQKRELPLMTLSSICEQYAPKEIHFLKIDVEGHEQAVLDGMDFARHRPWILVIEATEPNSMVDSSVSWEPQLVDSGYLFAAFDGLSKFYVAKEKPDLLNAFRVPPNIFDNYITAAESQALEELKKTNSIKWLVGKLAQQVWDRASKALFFNKP